MSKSSSVTESPSPPPQTEPEEFHARKRSHQDMSDDDEPRSENVSGDSTPAQEQSPPRTNRTHSGQSFDGANSDESAREDQEQQDESSTIPPNPADEIPTLDWADLEAAYHAEIGKKNVEEQAINEEFHQLVSYFQVWMQTTSTHEVERSFKRLKTRMHHVQQSEEQLEKKRLHYISVVEAFQSALKLLNGP